MRGALMSIRQGMFVHFIQDMRRHADFESGGPA